MLRNIILLLCLQFMASAMVVMPVLAREWPDQRPADRITEDSPLWDDYQRYLANFRDTLPKLTPDQPRATTEENTDEEIPHAVVGSPMAKALTASGGPQATVPARPSAEKLLAAREAAAKEAARLASDDTERGGVKLNGVKRSSAKALPGHLE